MNTADVPMRDDALPPDETLEAYADVVLRVGVGLRPGRRLLVRAPLTAAPLARHVVRQAYRLGSPFVDVHWRDDQVTRDRFLEAPSDSFEELPVGRADAMTAMAERGDAIVSIVSSEPELLRDADPERIATAREANQRALRAFDRMIMRDAVPWTVLAVPNEAWAAKVFPDLPVDRAHARLWSAVLAAVRVDREDPVAAWREHAATLERRCAHLDARRYATLHFRGPGTDLTVGLADGHLWMGGTGTSEDGARFVPNLPTEEVFTAPHRDRVDGTVRITKPVLLDGRVVEGASLAFADGRVVDVAASRGHEVLERRIAADEGAARLGEVALVSVESPIHRTGLLFYDDLFDENAASHVALGRAYPFCIEGGGMLDEEEAAARGLNDSIVHSDLMIGSEEVDVDGIDGEGRAEPLMRAGRFVI